MSWDPYAALGLGRNAAADEIRRAYRKLAKELHPDVRPNDRTAEERFKRATAAFNLLSDPTLKARYDRGEIDADGNERGPAYARSGAGRGGFQGAGPGGAGPGGTAGDGVFDFGDIFADLFGSGGAYQARPGANYGRMRGRDMRFTLDVDFVDSIIGGRRRIQLADGRTLEVSIPPGVETGQVLRLKSQGGHGVNGGPPGDALVELTVKSHPLFRREGENVLMDLPISLKEAVEGARVQVPTPAGAVALVVPQGANTGMTLRLKGKGVGGHGDQFVRLLITLPEAQDDELKRFVKGWSGRDKLPPRPSAS